jgi:uncharacterized repeat protein (TIGR02543 family)
MNGKGRAIRVLVWSMAVLIALAFAPSGAFADADEGVTFGEQSNAASLAEKLAKTTEPVLFEEQAGIPALKAVTDKSVVAAKKADGIALKSVYNDNEPDNIENITVPENKLKPAGNVIAGKLVGVTVEGLNHKLYMSNVSASSGTVAYVPYAIYWPATKELVDFFDWSKNGYKHDGAYNFIIGVQDNKAETALFTAYYNKYTYNGTNWVWDDQNLYTQTLPLVVNGTLKYNANGGKTSKTVYVPNASKYAFPKVSRSGFKLDGWYTKAVGGTKLSASKKVAFTASKISVTVYAHWAKSVTVKFNTKGGKLKASVKKTRKVTHSKKYGTLPAPTKTGYKFRGWYPSASAKAKKVTKSTYVTKAKTHTLVAQWLKKGKGKYITKSEYKLLKKGYTYAECNTIVGGKGVLVGEDSGAKVYLWLGDKDGKTGAMAGFENGVLTEKLYVDENENIL